MQPKTDKLLFYSTLFLSFVTVVFIYLKADSPYDTGDGIAHYQIARYSWKYPHLLLDLWGKPFFTLVSSPFAQFGLKGMYVFQALNAAAISWFLYTIASKINLKYTFSIPVFVFFAPVYFAVMNSGLVEVFFGTMFMLSAWLVFHKRYYASALVASMIPFVRPEAYVVIPLLIVIYIYRRKFLAIPVLLTSALVYTVIGYFYFKDWQWIITQNYKLVGDNYAGSGLKGSYFHYFGVYEQIWGTAYTVLLLLGIVIILIQMYRLLRRKTENDFVVEVFFLFLGSTVGFFTLHSLLCGMPGILNNLGMLRYVAVLIPGSALIALIGLNSITAKVFDKVNFLRPAVVLAVLFFLVKSSFSQWYYPFKPYNEQYVMKQMSAYIQTNWPDFKKVCFLHPSLPVFADLDPYDLKRVEMLWSANLEALNRFPDSTLVLWDSHFMKGEGKIPLNWLSENPNYVLLKHYKFSNEELPFETYLFVKTSNHRIIANAVRAELVSPEGIIVKSDEPDSVMVSFANDTIAFRKWFQLKARVAGNDALQFKPELEYGPVFSKKIRDFNLKGRLNSVALRFKLFQSDTSKTMVSVLEIRDKDNLVSWNGLVLNKQTLVPNRWNSVKLEFNYKEPVQNTDFLMNIYFWNKEKKMFYVDDLEITFASGTKTQ